MLSTASVVMGSGEASAGQSGLPRKVRVEYGLDGWLGQGECLAGGLPRRAMRSLPSVVVGSGRRWAGGAAKGGRVEYGLCGGWLKQGQRKGFLFVGGKLGLDGGEGCSKHLLVDDAAGCLELLEDMLACFLGHDDAQVRSRQARGSRGCRGRPC